MPASIVIFFLKRDCLWCFSMSFSLNQLWSLNYLGTSEIDFFLQECMRPKAERGLCKLCRSRPFATCTEKCPTDCLVHFTIGRRQACLSSFLSLSYSICIVLNRGDQEGSPLLVSLALSLSLSHESVQVEYRMFPSLESWVLTGTPARIFKK